MSDSLVRNMRVALVIAVFIVYFGHQREAVVEAAPIVSDWCYEVCDQNASCLEPCRVPQPELPALEITCGMYDGGPANDWCDGNGCADHCAQWWSGASDVCYWQNEQTTCEGYGVFPFCGDLTCAAVQGEDCSSCEEDCGCPLDPAPVCGSYGCEVGESWRTCPQDCGLPPGDNDCGDGYCDEEEDGYSCSQDCHFSGDYCGEFGAECPDGWDCIEDVCTWHVTHYICCGDSPLGDQCDYGPEVCAADEVCKGLAGFSPYYDPPVCQKRWTS